VINHERRTKNEYMTTKILSEITGISERQARYDLNSLVNKGLISAEGETTSRRYKLRQSSAIFGKKRK